MNATVYESKIYATQSIPGAQKVPDWRHRMGDGDFVDRPPLQGGSVIM